MTYLSFFYVKEHYKLSKRVILHNIQIILVKKWVTNTSKYYINVLRKIFITNTLIE